MNKLSIVKNWGIEKNPFEVIQNGSESNSVPKI